MQLYLPDITYWLLIRSGTETAHSYLLAYNELSYFTHAMEILLHRVLEGDLIADDSESEGMKTSDASLRKKHLNLVVDLLDRFPQALEIVVSCARKTEATAWRKLFEAVGSPKDLFRVSLYRAAVNPLHQV